MPRRDMPENSWSAAAQSPPRPHALMVALYVMTFGTHETAGAFDNSRTAFRHCALIASALVTALALMTSDAAVGSDIIERSCNARVHCQPFWHALMPAFMLMASADMHREGKMEMQSNACCHCRAFSHAVIVELKRTMFAPCLVAEVSQRSSSPLSHCWAAPRRRIITHMGGGASKYVLVHDPAACLGGYAYLMPVMTDAASETKKDTAYANHATNGSRVACLLGS